MTVRDERPEDIDAIRAVHRAAFGQPQEGRIVDALRANHAVLLSLVATVKSHLVGHILYTPVAIGPQGEELIGAGLGPMAVLPDYQRQGIGSTLVDTAHRRLRQDGCPFIVVVGHPDYYPRFGFAPARGHGIHCEWEVPDDAFMLLVLDPSMMKGISGLARYRREFSRIGGHTLNSDWG